MIYMSIKKTTKNVKKERLNIAFNG